jgi:hypothetical protein
MSEEPRPKVGASSKEKARLNWGHMPPITWAIHPRAQLTCNSTLHYLAFSRKRAKKGDLEHEGHGAKGVL